ncbi:uncharacterized protein PV09_02591 [Verruconis gallopava]|uniref:Uncharacterized protein n=1 Tax=Verruconis gallopava TaxID=253628 RepID=A0A0D2AK37_9PEZI|nr:uncharacterized protein PV09_02591 [Verruconis gallopava]KIW06925.1 hypothetical protein PV09_02591 [Verruconis gallopava]
MPPTPTTSKTQKTDAMSIAAETGDCISSGRMRPPSQAAVVKSVRKTIMGGLCWRRVLLSRILDARELGYSTSLVLHSFIPERRTGWRAQLLGVLAIWHIQLRVRTVIASFWTWRAQNTGRNEGHNLLLADSFSREGLHRSCALRRQHSGSGQAARRPEERWEDI